MRLFPRRIFYEARDSPFENQSQPFSAAAVRSFERVPPDPGRVRRRAKRRQNESQNIATDQSRARRLAREETSAKLRARRRESFLGFVCAGQPAAREARRMARQLRRVLWRRRQLETGIEARRRTRQGDAILPAETSARRRNRIAARTLRGGYGGDAEYAFAFDRRQSLGDARRVEEYGAGSIASWRVDVAGAGECRRTHALYHFQSTKPECDVRRRRVRRRLEINRRRAVVDADQRSDSQHPGQRVGAGA